MNGYGISLSEIRELINDKNGENFLSNEEIKLFLVESFGSSIQFRPSERKNESLMVFQVKSSFRTLLRRYVLLTILK